MPTNPPKPWLPEEEEAIREAVRTNVSVLKLASKLGRKVSAVQRRARIIGSPFPHRKSALTESKH